MAFSYAAAVAAYENDDDDELCSESLPAGRVLQPGCSA